MDVSVRSTMKGAAKCDKHCELQNSVNRQGLERILCFWGSPRKHAYFSVHPLGSSRCCPVWGHAAAIACASRCALALLRHLIHMALLRQPAKTSVLYACVALCCGIRLLIFARLPSSLDMKLGWQTR